MAAALTQAADQRLEIAERGRAGCRPRCGRFQVPAGILYSSSTYSGAGMA
jgi:hypothetical protein